MKKDPVVEKLDEILKTLKRIEAKPTPVPFYFYPPYYVQPYVQPGMPVPVYPGYPYSTWITVTNPTVGSGSGTINTNGGSQQAGITFTNAQRGATADQSCLGNVLGTT